MAPPPGFPALFLSFPVSLPGSPGAGMTYLRHAPLPVVPSSPAMKTRTPRSPPAAPTMILSFPPSCASRLGGQLVHGAVGRPEACKRRAVGRRARPRGGERAGGRGWGGRRRGGVGGGGARFLSRAGGAAAAPSSTGEPRSPGRYSV